MALKRYIGLADAVEVRIEGDDYGVVRQGETLAVEDDVAARQMWPADAREDAAPATPPAKPVQGSEK